MLVKKRVVGILLDSLQTHASVPFEERHRSALAKHSATWPSPIERMVDEDRNHPGQETPGARIMNGRQGPANGRHRRHIALACAGRLSSA